MAKWNVGRGEECADGNYPTVRAGCAQGKHHPRKHPRKITRTKIKNNVIGFNDMLIVGVADVGVV